MLSITSFLSSSNCTPGRFNTTSSYMRDFPQRQKKQIKERLCDVVLNIKGGTFAKE